MSTLTPKRVKQPRWRRVPKRNYALLGIIVSLSVFPFYWMFVVASNTNAEISKSPPSLIPGGRFLIVARKVLSAQGVYFNSALLNTFIVGISIALAQVIFSAIAGFAFAKLDFKGRKGLILFVIGTMMLPSQLGIIPLFMLVKNLHMVDTLYGLIVPALITAFGVFWMRQCHVSSSESFFQSCAKVVSYLAYSPSWLHGTTISGQLSFCKVRSTSLCKLL